jgi:hypothetical protein
MDIQIRTDQLSHFLSNLAELVAGGSPGVNQLLPTVGLSRVRLQEMLKQLRWLKEQVSILEKWSENWAMLYKLNLTKGQIMLLLLYCAASFNSSQFCSPPACILVDKTYIREIKMYFEGWIWSVHYDQIGGIKEDNVVGKIERERNGESVTKIGKLIRCLSVSGIFKFRLFFRDLYWVLQRCWQRHLHPTAAEMNALLSEYFEEKGK